MDNKLLLMGVTLVLFSSLFMFGLYNLANIPQDTYKVDCYDRHNNKIEGLTCDKLVYKNPLIEEIAPHATLFVFPLALMVVMGLISIGVGLFSTEENTAHKIKGGQ